MSSYDWHAFQVFDDKVMLNVLSKKAFVTNDSSVQKFEFEKKLDNHKLALVVEKIALGEWWRRQSLSAVFLEGFPLNQKVSFSISGELVQEIEFFKTGGFAVSFGPRKADDVIE
jgi:hypothetical protein